MKVRAAITRTARRPALTVVGWALLTILVAAAVSACTSSPPSTSVYLPTASGSTSSDGTSTATVTASVSDSTLTSPSTLPTNTVTVTITPTYSPVPTAAPVTGGGGTAGLQDGALFMIGGVAILFGAGSFLYRKKLTKHR